MIEQTVSVDQINFCRSKIWFTEVPELTGKRVPSVGSQEGIMTGSGKTRGPKPVKDEIP